MIFRGSTKYIGTLWRVSANGYVVKILPRIFKVCTALSQLLLFCLDREQFLFLGHLHKIYLVGHSCLKVSFKRLGCQTEFLFRPGKRPGKMAKIHFFRYELYLRLFLMSDFDEIWIEISLHKYLTPIQIS